MALSSDLISQLVQVTNDVKTDKPSNVVYGTVVEYEGEKYVRIDGSERLTRANKVTDAEVNERVMVTIENHTATITGNISSPSARTDRVEELGGEIHKVGILVAGKVSTEELIANYAKITDLTAQTARIDSLVAEDVVIEKRLDAAEAVIVTLNATYATIDKLESEYATIKKLESEYTTTTNLEAKYATISKLESDYATIAKLESDYIKTTEIDAKYATIAKLENEYASIAHLTANYATAVELQAVDAKIGSLDTEVADINTLIFGSATGNTIHINFANAVIAQLGDAQIKSAMIKDISAAKITSGDIITDNVNVKSQDGRLLIADQTIQISDTTRVRVQIGKDASGDYSINIWDANGKLMFSEGGLTEDAVKEQIIRNDMVKDDANISASKLNINSLFDVINEDGSNTIKSTKVYLDEEGQTLDVSFKSMTTKIDGISVGGRNLLKNTKSFTGITGHSVNASLTGETYRDLAIRYLDCTDMEVSPTSYRDMCQWLQSIEAEGNGQYTFSFYAKGTKVRAHFYDGAFSVVYCESSQGRVKTTATDGAMDFTLTDEWARYWVVYKVEETNTQSKTTPKNVLLRVMGGEKAYICGVKFEKGNKATDWTPAPEDIDATTTELSSKYHDLTVDISTLESRIGEQSQLIEKKADGSTVTALSTKYSTLEQTVDGLSVTVGSHTSQIANKADGSTVTALSEQYTALSADLSGFKTTVRDTYTTKTEFDKLKVGGRNLLLNTGRDGTIKLNTADAPSHLGSVQPTNSGGLLTLNCSTSTQEIYYRFMNPLMSGTNMYGLEPGGTYTFSGKVKVSTTSGMLINVVARSQDRVGAWSGGAATVIADADSDEWISFESTFTIRENAECCYTSIQVYYEGSWVGVVQLKDLKFEKGSMATDWTPAPEDVDADISKSAETVTTQTAELLGSYATKVDLDGYYTKSQTESAIEQKADSITSTVASTYSTKADLAALRVGGRNLIADTSLDTVYSGAINPDIGYRDIWSAKTIDIPVGTEYVVSFDAKADEEMDIRCFFYSPNTTLTSESSTGDRRNNVTDGVSVVHITTEWKRYWVKWTQTPADTKKSVIVGRHSSSTNSVYIRAIKLEEGHVPTDWTPAPEDVDTEFGSVRSEIQQLADSITLSVTGTLGSTASIKLTANGQTTEKKIDIDMSKIREAFANDSTAIDISAGTITFSAGTLLINSGNFTLDGAGNIVAKSGTIGGWTIDSDRIVSGSTSGHVCGLVGTNNPTAPAFFAGGLSGGGVYANFKVLNNGTVISTDQSKLQTKMSGGVLQIYYDDELRAKLEGSGLGLYYGEDSSGNPILCGTITSQLIEDAYQTTSLILRIPKNGDMRFAIESAAGGVVTHYVLKDTADITFDHADNDTYAHTFVNGSLFMGVTKFASTVHHNGMAYFRNQTAIGWYDASGKGPYQFISVGSDNIFTLGSDSYTTTIDGSIINLSAKSRVHMINGVEELIFDGLDSIGTYSGYFYPKNTGYCCLGVSANRWYNVYLKNSPNVSSDIRLKKNIVGLSDEHSELFDRLQPVQYNMIEGDDRIHYGFVAQQVTSAMAELGIDEDDLDLVQHAHWIDEETKTSCEEYGMAYNNFIAMLVHEVQKLKREIKTLKGE